MVTARFSPHLPWLQESQMGLLAYIKSLGISQPSHWLKYGVTNSLGEFSELFMNLWICGQLRPVESGDTSWHLSPQNKGKPITVPHIESHLRPVRIKCRTPSKWAVTFIWQEIVTLRQKLALTDSHFSAR